MWELISLHTGIGICSTQGKGLRLGITEALPSRQMRYGCSSAVAIDENTDLTEGHTAFAHRSCNSVLDDASRLTQQISVHSSC